MNKKTSTNAAWNSIFKKLPISESIKAQGIFPISAAKISELSGREPRLMAKFDQRNHRPRILQSQGITILPASNGRYVLLAGDGYIDIPETPEPERYPTSKLDNVRSIPWREGIHSESQAIDSLFLASAVRFFVGDESLQPTIRGKFRSRPFDFRFSTTIGEKDITVDGAQLEIDSGSEGDVLVLVEAKLGTVSDTIIRQLYYPFKHFEALKIGKKIICLLLVYSNKIYSLYEFSFRSAGVYQSASISRQAHYLLEPPGAIPRFADVISSRTTQPPRGVPFPQADDLSKIIDAVEILSSEPQNKFELAEKFDVDPRQGDYYGNSAIWLGLAEKSNHDFSLTQQGASFARLDRAGRLAKLTELVTRVPIFNEAAKEYARDLEPDIHDIARRVMRDFKLSESTGERRAETVRAWIRWLSSQLRS
ncbi:MAG: hypothetical protein WBW54_24785 [Candidatus Acidiferrales bacterium]